MKVGERLAQVMSCVSAIFCDLAVGSRRLPTAKTEESLERSHGRAASVVAEREFVEVNL